MAEASYVDTLDLMARLRVTVTLSEDVYKTLSEWAEEEERTLANLMAYIAAKAAKEHQQQNETPSPKKGKGDAA